MSTAALSILDAVVDKVTAAVGSTAVVWDGPPPGDEPGRVMVCVGVADPTDISESESTQASQSWAHAGGRDRDEEGVVTLSIVVTSGSDDMRGARAEAGAVLTAIVQDFARSPDPSLGVPGLLWQSVGEGGVTVAQDRTVRGAVVRVTLGVQWRARHSH